jgi:hypothetical protein
MHAHLLSPLNEHLAAELRRDPAMASVRFDICHESVPEFLRGYPYVEGTWPVFVTRSVIREHFEPLIERMPRLLCSVLRARFSHSEAMAEYFGWPDLICQMIEQSEIDPRDLVMRFDAILNNSGLKILENNSGTSTGGWHTDYFHLQMRARLSRFAQSHGVKFEFHPILPSLLKAVAGSILRHKPGVSGNLLFHATFSSGGPKLANFCDSVQKVYDAIKPPELSAGRVVVFHDFSEIGFTAEGEVTAHGQTIDAILLGDMLLTGMPQILLNRLLAAQLRDLLVFPDSPLHLVMGNKGLLTVMHECRTARLLDSDDCAFIERYIPWSVRLQDDEVLLEGAWVPLVPHMLAHKDNFVIKQSDLSAGRGVMVGRNVDATTWESMIRECLQAKTLYIVQQFCAPGVQDLHDAERGVVPHSLIWGLYCSGAEYGGIWVRTDRGAAMQGAINSGMGASDMPVFVVD